LSSSVNSTTQPDALLLILTNVVISKPKCCINRIIFNLSFPQSLSGNPPFDKLRVTFVMVSLSNHGCPIKNFGHDENITVRSQLMVDFKTYVIIWLKCASVLHLQISFSNIYATGE